MVFDLQKIYSYSTQREVKREQVTGRTMQLKDNQYFGKEKEVKENGKEKKWEHEQGWE